MATYYLNADSGNDTTGDGSSGNPWLTVSKAHTSAASGDTIILQASTNPYTFTSITFSKSLTLSGASGDPEDQILDGGGLTVQWTYSGSYTITLNNLVFQDAISSAVANQKGIFFRNGAGTVGFEATDCIFRDLEIHKDSNTGGILCVISATATLTLTRCAFYNITANTGADVNCPFFFFRASALADISITNCTMLQAGTGAALVDCFFTLLTVTQKEIVAKNSIFGTTGDSPAWVSGTWTLESVTYCNHYGVTSPPAGTGNITTDPLFVDAANGNFNLRPTSPCIDTGILI